MDPDVLYQYFDSVRTKDPQRASQAFTRDGQIITSKGIVDTPEGRAQFYAKGVLSGDPKVFDFDPKVSVLLVANPFSGESRRKLLMTCIDIVKTHHLPERQEQVFRVMNQFDVELPAGPGGDPLVRSMEVTSRGGYVPAGDAASVPIQAGPDDLRSTPQVHRRPADDKSCGARQVSRTFGRLLCAMESGSQDIAQLFADDAFITTPDGQRLDGGQIAPYFQAWLASGKVTLQHGTLCWMRDGDRVAGGDAIGARVLMNRQGQAQIVMMVCHVDEQQRITRLELGGGRHYQSFRV